MSEPLKRIHRRIFRTRGTIFESDIFSVLHHSPFVVRGFEFALADGAIDCSREYTAESSFAERFSDLYDRDTAANERSTLLLFDVKSTTAPEAGAQAYYAPRRQRRRVAFFIGINAADPTFVEIIPNLAQEAAALSETAEYDEDNDQEVNVTRRARLTPRRYGGLDQSGSPYRLPLWMLPQALRLIREHVNKGVPYINPWTRVYFSDWHPITTTRSEWLHPAEHTQQFSACMTLLDIFDMVRGQAVSLLEPGFVGVQPALADFKLILPGREHMVQHKFDDQLRAHDALFTRVDIARGERFYFTCFDRFDWLWYQFRISSHPASASDRKIFFFIPECALPDEMYTTLQRDVSFERPEFKEFCIAMDDDGEWVGKIERLLQRYPQPRKDGERPLRVSTVSAALLETTQLDVALPQSANAAISKGTRDYVEALTISMRRFFDAVMIECALRQSGLLVALATNHPEGDVAFCRYQWTSAESKMFITTRRPPLVAHHLPPDAELVPLCYYTQYAESSHQGPMLRARQFRRLDSCKGSRLVIWDLGGHDTSAQPWMPVVIPTDDIRATASQQQTLHRALDERTNTPLVAAVLATGLRASEYAVRQQGPEVYRQAAWGAMWESLFSFLALQPTEHPAGKLRNPSAFRRTMQALNQTLADQHSYDGPKGNDFEE
ncbi:hypothetical protein LTR17_022024 [Elasticomyces elasticus]|nr:hypothetical protein LTR17_022024 [Elasticomyces elasticus]